MKAIKPALVIKETILSHSSIQIEINTTKNKITDSLWTIRVLETTKSVIKLLTIIPRITGTVTIKNIFVAISIIDISPAISTPKKFAELKTINGTIKIDSKLTIAVKLTDKATSPSANLTLAPQSPGLPMN